MLRVQENSLEWALRHVERFGDTDVFPPPFEYKAIRHDWDRIRKYLTSQNILEWHTRPQRTFLAPKGMYGFRVVTQLDPLDFLLFTATIKEIAEDLESRRIDKTRGIVHSFRYISNSDGRFFDSEINYQTFLKASKVNLDDNPQFTHVATADIADFYSRIYHHRLENALRSASSRTSHINAIMRFLAGWNATETFGIPVGSSPVRLLAEIAISDIDEALLAYNIKFIRYNDDYRFFGLSYSNAYRHIAFLAEALYRNHGLSLQPQKTTVLTRSEFKERFLSTVEDREIDSLEERFGEIIGALGLEDWYVPINYDDLSPELQEMVAALNLSELFTEEIERSAEPDLPTIRFYLRRFAQLGDASVLELV
jgi:hypothetical protein